MRLERLQHLFVPLVLHHSEDHADAFRVMLSQKRGQRPGAVGIVRAVQEEWRRSFNSLEPAWPDYGTHALLNTVAVQLQALRRTDCDNHVFDLMPAGKTRPQ